MLIEYEDVEERQRALATLQGIEHRVYVQVEGQPRVYAIADEDLDRSTAEKTAAVHFLRFELSPEMIDALKGAAALGAGVDHEKYTAEVRSLPAETRASLVADLTG
jgi:precorrin-3B methylase